MSASVTRVPRPSPRTHVMRSDAPQIFEARTTSSRRPRFLSQAPIVSSVFPCVSASVGTGYISAVSKKFRPYSSKAQSNCCTPSSSVFCLPQVIVPRHTSLTTRSEVPSCLLLMGVPADIEMACRGGERRAHADTASSRSIVIRVPALVMALLC